VTVIAGETSIALAKLARVSLAGEKYFVSITSVSPSHQLIESPSQLWIAAGACFANDNVRC
jgi:hypothetical protein